VPLLLQSAQLSESDLAKQAVPPDVIVRQTTPSDSPLNCRVNHILFIVSGEPRRAAAAAVGPALRIGPRQAG